MKSCRICIRHLLVDLGQDSAEETVSEPDKVYRPVGMKGEDLLAVTEEVELILTDLDWRAAVLRR